MKHKRAGFQLSTLVLSMLSMTHLHAEDNTVEYVQVIGQAASMGSFLLAAGAKGKRFSLPNSRIMVHQPSAGYQGQATDIEIHAKEISSLKKRLNKIYAKHTKKSEEEIKKALERDNFMSPNEAKDFGLIDEVVEKRI